jgi:Fe-S oxidoreductase
LLVHRPESVPVTTTYDPTTSEYHDEADLRTELTRVYDLCHECRLCYSLCPAFPSLFEMIDAKQGAVDALTAAEQDRVVDQCYQCKLCYVKCPYVPPHDWALDFPRLMLRADTVRREKGGGRVATKLADQLLGRTDTVGKIGSLTAAVANRVLDAPGSPVRKLMSMTVGVAAQRVLPPYARVRFSTWFSRHTPRMGRSPQGSVAVFPTCIVEYQQPEIGKDLVRVYEHNGIDCSLVDRARCCGAPWLHAGDFDQFLKQARENVAALANSVRQGRDVVVPQPTCGYVLKKDYPEHVGGPDARLVADNTYDACEYLWRLHKGDRTSLDTDFIGEVPPTTAYHAPCHLQAQNIGLKSRDLLKLTGTRLTEVSKCSGIDGMWGYREKNYALSSQVARVLGDALLEADAAVIAGDCHLANGSIVQETGRTPLHPLQVLARAYGLEPVD